VLALSLGASESDSRWLRLIGPDTYMVFGADVSRYQASVLNDFFPLRLPASLESAKDIRRTLTIENRNSGEVHWLTVMTGTFAKRSEDNPDPGFAVLDANTAIVGDPENVRDALRRWAKPEPPDER